MILEIMIFAVSIAAIVSSLDFISKSFSGFAHSLGIPEYLAGTIVLSFIISLPVFLIMLISNIFNVPTFGISTIVGFSIATITLVMGIFLLNNEIPVEYEKYRNSTFMWAAALLFFIVSLDKFIDRADALFLISLFVFYVLYLYYRTSKSKEYVYFKPRKSNAILFLPAVLVIILSTIAAISTISIISRAYIFSIALFSIAILSFILVLPLFDLIKNIFRNPILTFDNLLGNVVITLTLIPGIVALIEPIPYNLNYNLGFMPLLFLNLVCLSFALITRLRAKIHKKTGAVLIVSYIIFLLMLLFVI